MDRIKVLFVCSRNQWRSPTAESIYRKDQRIDARSRGTSKSAKRRLRATDIVWSDIIFVMEKKHRTLMRKEFAAEIDLKRIVVLEIPDEYQFMDPELVESIRAGVSSELGHQQEGENGK